MERIMRTQALGDPRSMEYMRVSGMRVVGGRALCSHCGASWQAGNNGHAPSVAPCPPHSSQGRKILEINPEHDILVGVKQLLADKAEEQARDIAEVLYETALITSGFQVDSPKEYASKVFTLMRIALGQDPAEAAAAQQAGARAAAPSSGPVEAEVIDPNDPWKKQQ